MTFPTNDRLLKILVRVLAQKKEIGLAVLCLDADDREAAQFLINSFHLLEQHTLGGIRFLRFCPGGCEKAFGIKP